MRRYGQMLSHRRAFFMQMDEPCDDKISELNISDDSCYWLHLPGRSASVKETILEMFS